MIGIHAKNGQLPIVSEFFELFKTPWEVYDPARFYDVVITTRSDGPLPEADLVIAFGAVRSAADDILGVAEGVRRRGGGVDHRGVRVPLYGELLSFEPAADHLACAHGSSGVLGLSISRGTTTVLRVGYDLFEEIGLLIGDGQPVEHAATATLDWHIDMIRTWLQDAKIRFVEIPPAPAGYSFSVCLTHDIDFVGIRDHKFDHSLFGFLLRASVGSIARVVRGRLSVTKLFGAWRAVATIPFVFLGWAADFWEPFQWYLTVERGLGATYFLIPFRRRAGSGHSGTAASRRATAYDVTTIRDAVNRLVDEGCEVGVHGIDAWHSVDAGRAERAKVIEVSGAKDVGIRMHWLLHDENTPRTLDQAGYLYDSTGGYNETIGYLHGTAQVFRPIGVSRMLELPMHIQDGALFFPERLDLSEREAWTLCGNLVSQTQTLGGVVTVLWHDRSHAPERYWGGFYIRLVSDLRSRGAWFATGTQVTRWFAARRAVRFERSSTGTDSHVDIRYDGSAVHPPFIVRVHDAATSPSAVDAPWTGDSPIAFATPRHHAAALQGNLTLRPAAGGC